MSQVATYREKKPVVAKEYAPGGCPIPLGEDKCGETQGLDIIMDFHKLYQEKMNEIDVSAGGDSLKDKVDLQEKWIEDLTAQNKLLARVIEELESETIDRVQQLEDKLNNAVKSFGEVIYYLAHDLKSLLEFIRRIREEKKWSIAGLYFYEVSWEDLFGSRSKMPGNEKASRKGKTKEQILSRRRDESPINTLSDVNSINLSFKVDENRALAEKEKKIKELEDNLRALPVREEDLKEKTAESDILKQEMNEMKAALTEEIARKHDVISLLRREIYHLEEKNCETMRDTSIKDDIIKELRKELKRSKQKEITLEDCIISDIHPVGTSKEITNEIEQELICEDYTITNVDAEEQPKKNTTEIQQPEMQEEEIESHSMSEIRSEEEKPDEKEILQEELEKQQSYIEPSLDEEGEKKENIDEILKPDEKTSEAQSSVTGSNIPPSSSMETEVDEELSASPDKQKALSKITWDDTWSDQLLFVIPYKISSKSVHLLVDGGKEGSQVVEPQKDLTMSPDFPEKPLTDSVPMLGTQDSLELQGKSPQVSEKKLTDEDIDNVCICIDKDYWEQLDKLKEENKMLREGSELQRLKEEVEEKMKRILELNEENRTLNDMINMLRTNQPTKKQKEVRSDSEPMTSDSDYPTGGCEPSRTPVKTSTPKRRVCREKCGYQNRDLPNPTQINRNICICGEDHEKGNESPPCIDVYKREDRGKFISDSSSTVCNEEACPFLIGKIPPYYSKERARGGNDTNNQCPAETFPNSQYVMDECHDSTCPNKDITPVTQAIDSNFVDCGPNNIASTCENISCQTKECEDYPVNLGPPLPHSVEGSCMKTMCEEKQEIGIAADLDIECNDESCPNKDHYPFPLSGTGQEPIGGIRGEQAPKSGFPITCTDSSCRVLDCSGGDDVPQGKSQGLVKASEEGQIPAQIIAPPVPPFYCEDRPSDTMENEQEVCDECGCQLTIRNILEGHTCDEVIGAATSDKVMPPESAETPKEPIDDIGIPPKSSMPQGTPTEMNLEPRTSDQDFCKDPCDCEVTENETNFDSNEPKPSLTKEGTAVGEKTSSAIENPPSIEVTEKPSAADDTSPVVGEEPTPVVSEKPSAVVSEKPSTVVSEKPSGVVSEKPSVPVSDKPSAQVTEEASEPLGAPASSNADDVCGDSICDEKFPNNESQGVDGKVPTEQPKNIPSSPGGEDKTIIRCICKSKFCKIIPDPDNQNQRLCVDSSGTNMKRIHSSCVCLPSCPKSDYDNPESSEEHCSPGTDAPGAISSMMPGSQYPKETTVLTVNQLYFMPNTPGSLSKEQEYAGLSRKDNTTRNSMYIAPRKATSQYGIEDDEKGLTGNAEIKNADLKLVIADLKSKLLDAEDKIEELKIGKIYIDKDTDTEVITKYSENINTIKKSLKWTKKEREEYEYLKQRVKLLEQGKGDTDNITSNLQTAVDLYVDTIVLLETSELKLKAEIEQYRSLNEALNENILNMRQEIEEMKKIFQQEIDDQKWINFVLHVDNVDIQHTNQIYTEQIQKYQKLYKQLMELNYELETDHVNNLQDLAMMEAQFNKYQSIYKIQEDEKIVIKNQLKKLTKKNKCYEEVVQFFKDEMSVMSDELLTLQEVLNVTNVSSQEENNKLIGAILQLRRINDRLVGHLCAIEKQVVLENQINQISEARINELQNIISDKNNDLAQHDDIIQDMRRKLNNATRQNTDLKTTIKNLTDTVVEIQEGIKSVEREQMKNVNDVSVVESKVCLANGDLESIKICMEQKNSRIVELESQLKSQEVDLILATKELGMLKEKKADSKNMINSLKEQLSIAEKKTQQIVGDYQKVVKKLQDFSSLEHMKNYELNHYKSLVEEMKMSMVQLNNGLEKCEASNIHFYEDLRNSDPLRGRLQHRKNNLPIVFDELKKSMAGLKKRLSDADFKGGLIEEELLKVKESHMSQISEEVTDTQNEVGAKIISYIEEQSRLNQLVQEQKDEIERLQRELVKEKADVCCCKRSVSELKNEKTSSNAQMEISHLKCELNKSINRQKLLNEENDQIHTQMINLRKKLTVLEQAYDVLKQENEEYNLQLKKTTREKEYLAHKNHDLTKTIEQMRSTHDQLEKQCRYSNDCVRNLELELSETITEKETVSSEAKNLVGVVKMWLQEQNLVNGEIRGKFQSYSDTITSLKQTIMKRMSDERSWIQTPMQQPFSQRRYGTMANLDRRIVSPIRTRKLERHTADARYRSSSPWRDLSAYMTDEYLAEDTHSHRSNIVRNISYDSNSSPYTSRSPSPRSNSIHGEEDDLDEMNLNDWFSPNYKEADTDADEREEDTYINKVHLMTAQIQEANKRWQKKMNKEHLSKSRASNK